MLFLNPDHHRFDIVTLVGPKDVALLKHQIEHSKKNIVGYRNIYLIPSDPDIQLDGCVTVDEKIFPFSIKDVIRYHGKQRKNGWYLQQLLKLYAGFVLPISKRYLVIDADTFFLRPIHFIYEDKSILNFTAPIHRDPFFDHMKKIHPSLGESYETSFGDIEVQLSGITHHMMFETKYLKELFDLVEDYHKKEFWEVFLGNVAFPAGQGASEYEIYFHYMLKYHRKEIKIRCLKWKNARDLTSAQEYDYISCHWHMR